MLERRLPTEQPPTPPGEMLLEEFLKPLNLSQSAFAILLGVSFPRLNEIIRGKRSVTPDTALRLARVTEMSADFWLGLAGLGSLACVTLERCYSHCAAQASSEDQLTCALTRHSS